MKIMLLSLLIGMALAGCVDSDQTKHPDPYEAFLSKTDSTIELVREVVVIKAKVDSMAPSWLGISPEERSKGLFLYTQRTIDLVIDSVADGKEISKLMVMFNNKVNLSKEVSDRADAIYSSIPDTGLRKQEVWQQSREKLKALYDQ